MALTARNSGDNVMVDIKLMQGDCLERMKEIPDGSVDAVIADPPYGTTACKWDSVIPFEPMWEQLKRVIKPNGAIVLFGSQPFTSVLVMSNLKWFKYCWVWNKKQTGNPFLANRQPLKIHEDIIVFHSERYFPIMRQGKFRQKGGGAKSQIFGNTESKTNDQYYPVSILEYPNCDYRAGKTHPTQKPVSLFEYLIRTYTNEDETVLDFTMGSGTTGVACVKTKRDFIGIELDEGYFKIAEQRIMETEPPIF